LDLKNQGTYQKSIKVLGGILELGVYLATLTDFYTVGIKNITVDNTGIFIASYVASI